MPKTLKTNPHRQAIDRNVAKRQQLKVQWDKHCKYSAEDQDSLPSSLTLFSNEVSVSLANKEQENWVRMLDEGTVVDGDGFCYAVIKKGALKAFYESLPEDFEGYIDRDHNRSIRLGNYTKNDLRLVELEDGRYGLDVNVKLDDGYYATRDLLRQNEHRAVSVEMDTRVEQFSSASKVTGDEAQGEYLVPLINTVNIIGYAVCENPKNANSIKDDLLVKASVEGENMNDEELKKLEAEDAVEATEAPAEEVGQEVEATTEDAPVEGADTDPKAPSESAGADADEVSETSDEPDEEMEATEEAEETVEAQPEDTAEAQEDLSEGLEQLEAAITELRAQMAEKDAKIAELENQLTAKAEVKMSNAERIAKLLNFATGADATAAEGSEVKTSSDTAESKYAADDALWDEAAKSLNY